MKRTNVESFKREPHPESAVHFPAFAYRENSSAAVNCPPPFFISSGAYDRPLHQPPNPYTRSEMWGVSFMSQHAPPVNFRSPTYGFQQHFSRTPCLDILARKARELAARDAAKNRKRSSKPCMVEKEVKHHEAKAFQTSGSRTSGIEYPVHSTDQVTPTPMSPGVSRGFVHITPQPARNTSEMQSNAVHHEEGNVPDAGPTDPIKFRPYLHDVVHRSEKSDSKTQSVNEEHLASSSHEQLNSGDCEASKGMHPSSENTLFECAFSNQASTSEVRQEKSPITKQDSPAFEKFESSVFTECGGAGDSATRNNYSGTAIVQTQEHFSVNGAAARISEDAASCIDDIDVVD